MTSGPESTEQTATVYVARLEWGTLRVTGPDRVAWLNGIVTCDVAEVTRERGVWGLLLSKQGKIEAELQLLAAEDALLIGVSGAAAADVASALDHYLVMEDAEVEELPAHRWWELHGPRAT